LIWDNHCEELASEQWEHLFPHFDGPGFTATLKDLSHGLLSQAADFRCGQHETCPGGNRVNEVPLSLIQVPKNATKVRVIRSLREPQSPDFSQVPLNHSQAGMHCLWIQKFLFLPLEELMIERPWLEPQALASSQQVQQRVAKDF
jgi:hypothetical protein